MIPTPEAIARDLQEQIRETALRADSYARRRRYQKPIDWFQARWRLLTRDWVQVALHFVWVMTLGWAIALLLSSWPVGGGDSVGQASIALGSSLIFVVIVTGLLAGPLEAGRRLGDASWIASDAVLWGELAVVSLLSLLVVGIGASKPQPPEEFAAFLLTASGLALTGVVARRVIVLSDPALQLRRKQSRALERVGKLVAGGAQASRRALEQSGVDAEVADAINRIPDVYTQTSVAELVQYPLSVTRAAWRRGDDDLALRAYYEATTVVAEYARSVGALASDDAVLQLLRDETLDLHELASGPAGRRLSRGITARFVDLATSLVASKKGVTPTGDEQLAIPLAMTLETFVRSRIGDRRTTDVAAGISGIERLALAAIQAGDDWTAAYITKAILGLAPMSVGAGLGEVGFPAWQGALRVLAKLAGSENRDSHAFGALADDIVAAIDQVPQLPSVMSLHETGFAFVIGPTGSPGSLISTGQRIWLGAPDTRLVDVVRFSRRVVAALRHLIDRTADDYTRGVRTPELAETSYQFLVGAVQRRERDPSSQPAREALEDLASNTLATVRDLMLPSEEVSPPRALDHRKLLRIYLSAWQMALYASKDGNEVPAYFEHEAEALLSELVDLDEAVESPLFSGGLNLLASWLGKLGWSDQSAKVSAAAETLPDRTPRGLLSMEEGWGYALGQEFRIYAGSMMGPLYGRVGEFFAEAEG